GKESGVKFADYSSKNIGDCEKGIIKINSQIVGKANREPGFNFDGTKAEDMYYSDKPMNSHSIMSDPVFLKNDTTLKAYMNQLMTSLSIGDMETVALEMSSKFQNGSGGTYSSSILNKKVKENTAFITYHYNFLNELKLKLKSNDFSPKGMEPISMKLLNFSSFVDKVSGLGITIHQVWSVKAEIKNYFYNKCNCFYGFDLEYTFYDHFGLDWDDIVKHGSDRIPQYHTGDFFKAWYILQHYRSAKPFITEIKNSVYIGDNSKY
ncbi:MAG: DUF3289 family protein, partial [Moheibacter sp.]